MTETSCKVAGEVCSKDGEKPCAYDLIVTLGKIDQSDRCDPPYARGTEALILRQEIAEMVLTASLQVDGFVAEIDSESAEIRAVRDFLTDRQTNSVSRSTLWSAVGTGGGAVGSALALVGNTATAGNWVGAASGGIGTLFGFLGYFQGQRSPHACFPDLGSKPKMCPKLDLERNPVPTSDNAPKEKCDSSRCSPAMLHNLIFPDHQYYGFHSEYDEAINKYLSGNQPGKQTSWRQGLILSWPKEDAGKKDVDCNQGSGDKENCYQDKLQALQKKEALFSSNDSSRQLSIDDLTERANKLTDLRTVVARLNRDLSRLTEDLATGLRCPPRADAHLSTTEVNQ